MKKISSIKEHFLTDHYSITVAFWHKRRYHMYSDVIFGWVLWIWLSSWHFVSDILIFFAIAWKFAGGHAEPPLPLRRPEEARRSKRQPGAAEDKRSPMFKFCRRSDSETKPKYFEKSHNYSAKSTILSQK